MPASRQEKNHAKRVVRHLAKHYADAECALNYESPFQLLIATILSAQCTDERVNIVTAELFAKYPTAETLAKATQKQIEKIVKSAGFYRAKAKNIRNCAKQLVEQSSYRKQVFTIADTKKFMRSRAPFCKTC